MKRKKGLKVVIMILGILFALNILGFTVNSLFFAHERDSIKPYGQMVKVNQQKMHVFSLGSGKQTIVLLPGFGVALPCADFGPLMRELSKDYTVVCLEYFGTGFSDITDTPRTNRNYTEEIRTALSEGGFKPPYILLPHSASGIYCEYYATQYPQEIKAIILLDTTSTVPTQAKNPPKFLYSIGKIQQACGLTRLAASLMKPAQTVKNGYTKKEIRDSKVWINQVLNDTIIDQSLRMLENINEVGGRLFPSPVPVFKIISSQSLKRVGETYQSEHLKRLGSHCDSRILEGSHFIYQSNVSVLGNTIRSFLKQIK